MYRVIACVTEQHDLWLVVVAAFVCLFSWAGALFVLERVADALDATATHGFFSPLRPRDRHMGYPFHQHVGLQPRHVGGFSLAPTILSALIGVAGAWAAFEARRAFAVHTAR